MNYLSSLTALCLSILVLFTSCEDENFLDEIVTTTIEEPNQDTSIDQQVIVLSAPSVYNDYYGEVFQDIIDFQVEYANTINGKDEVLILCDQETMPYFTGRVPDNVLVEANIKDIWIRDFAPTIPNNQVKFNYLPYYHASSISNLIDNSFENWFNSQGLTYGKKSDLILDGGNVVDNGAGRVIVTDRFLSDNPSLTTATAKNKLKQLMGAYQVAIIKETPGDATGHSDGMLMWTDDNTILLHDQPVSVKADIIDELNSSFPGVEIVVVPDYYEDETWDVFSSACNIFVNALMTNNYIYVPTFNSPYDQEMLNLIQSHSDKIVVEVPAEKVCFMGGSVRCLSWQTDGAMADMLLD